MQDKDILLYNFNNLKNDKKEYEDSIQSWDYLLMSLKPKVSFKLNSVCLSEAIVENPNEIYIKLDETIIKTSNFQAKELLKEKSLIIDKVLDKLTNKPIKENKSNPNPNINKDINIPANKENYDDLIEAEEKIDEDTYNNYVNTKPKVLSNTPGKFLKKSEVFKEEVNFTSTKDFLNFLNEEKLPENKIKEESIKKEPINNDNSEEKDIPKKLSLFKQRQLKLKSK